MFFRKYEEIMGIAFPMEWRQSVSQSFGQYFKDKLNFSAASIQSFGFHHIDELVIIISYVPEEELKSPISLFISKDLSEKEKESEREFKKVKDSVLDVAGIILKDLSENFNDIEYLLRWTEYDFRKEKYFYKVTRENIDLSIKTEEILRES